MTPLLLILFLLAAPLVGETPSAGDTDIAGSVSAAFELIGSPAPPDDYRVSVSRSEEQTWVTFTAPVRYVPWMSEHYYEVTVALEGELLYYSSLRSPTDYSSGCVVLPFYRPSRVDEQAIEYVADVLATAWGFDFRDAPPDGRLTIYERERDFRIELVSESRESWYRIEKVTGRIVGEGHAEPALSPTL